MTTRQLSLVLLRKIGDAVIFSSTWIIVTKVFKFFGWL